MDSLIILDSNGIIHWTSPSVLGLLGYHPHELQGKKVFNLLSTINGKKTIELFQKIQERPTRINEGLRQFFTKSGEIIPLYMSFSRLPGYSLPDLMLLHLQLFKPKDSDSFSIPQEKAEIEAAQRKRKEYEIAAEMHDHINPNLIGAKLLLDYAIDNPVEHIIHLRKASTILNELIIGVRNLSHNILSNAGNDLELKEALNSIAENFRKGSETRIIIKTNKGIEKVISNKQKVHIIRIIQEQLVNIGKHASATKVLICLERANDKIRLVTKDNGKGFDPTHYHQGIGIRTMLLRVNELSGNMHINSKCGEGTTIRIIFPMKNKSATH